MTKNRLTVKVYIIKCAPGALAASHGARPIDVVEIFVPNESLHLNYTGGKLNMFIQGEHRYTEKHAVAKQIGSTSIDRDLVKRIIFNIEQREEIEDAVKVKLKEVTK